MSCGSHGMTEDYGFTPSVLKHVPLMARSGMNAFSRRGNRKIIAAKVKCKNDASQNWLEPEIESESDLYS